MNFDQELTLRYVDAGAGDDRPSPDGRRVARAVFVRDTIRTIYNADKTCGIDPADLASLAELLAATEKHLKQVNHHVRQMSPAHAADPGAGAADGSSRPEADPRSEARPERGSPDRAVLDPCRPGHRHSDTGPNPVSHQGERSA